MCGAPSSGGGGGSTGSNRLRGRSQSCNVGCEGFAAAFQQLDEWRLVLELASGTACVCQLRRIQRRLLCCE